MIKDQNDDFEQSCVWDLSNSEQIKYLKSLSGSSYSLVMDDLKDEWTKNGHDYQKAINTVLRE